MREHRLRSSLVFTAALIFTTGASLFTAEGPREASASVSIAVSLEELARASTVIAKITPLERTSAWQDGRIVTTTRIRIDDVVAGAAPSDARELRVRTLGGRVGDIGQSVEGEAMLSPGTASVVFLRPLREHEASADAAFVVAGRAQGQLLVKRDTHGREIVRIGPAVGELVERRVRPPLRQGGRRMTELDGLELPALTVETKRAWEAGHAK